MKIVAIAHRSDKHQPEDFAPHLDAESAYAMKLFADEKVRELYSRSDGNGAVLVLEADSVEDAEEMLSGLPLVKLGLLTIEVYGVQPYRGFVANVS